MLNLLCGVRLCVCQVEWQGAVFPVLPTLCLRENVRAAPLWTVCAVELTVFVCGAAANGESVASHHADAGPHIGSRTVC